jgi:hypothetical protein
MADTDALGLDEPTEFPYEFETDLHHLVITNHNLTLGAIERSEGEDLEKLDCSDPETLRSIENQLHDFYDDLRRAANNLAAVALVTRIQHWIIRLAKTACEKGKSKRGEKKRGERTLVTNLNYLNGHLGEGPIPVKFFAELVDARDSVIHGDSKQEWDRGRRRVASHYANSYGDTEINGEQLKEAAAKAAEQVKWYDGKLRALAPPR